MAKTPQELAAIYGTIRENGDKFLKDANDLENILNSLTQDQLNSYERLLQSVKDRVEQLQAEAEVTKILFTNTIENYKIREKELEVERSSLVEKEKLLRAQVELGQLSAAEYAQNVKDLQLQLRLNQAKKDGLTDIDNLMSKIGLKKADDTMFGAFFSEDAEKTIPARIGEYSGRLKEFTNATSLAANALSILGQNSLDMIGKMDSAAVSFNKATGFAGQFNDVVMDSTFNLRGFGIDASNAVNTLVTSYKGFGDLSKNLQTDLVESTAILDAQGFVAAKQAQNLQFLSMSFGLTAIEAQNFNVALDNMAENMGVPIGQLTDDFKNAQPVLAAATNNIEDMGLEFQKLESISKGTGLSVQRVLDITAKFDTFDGAAQSVGRLNAMLGGPYLSTLEMVSTTDPSKRFELMSRAVKDAAGSFDSLSYYQKKAIASSMGLSDVTELAAIMEGRTDLIGDPFESLSSDEILKKKEQMKEFQTTMEMFKGVLMELAISLKPVIVLLKAFIEPFAFILRAGDGWVGTIVSWMIAIYNLGKVLKFLNGALKITSFLSKITLGQWFLLISGFVLGITVGPKFASIIGGISLAVAALAFVLGQAALALGALTFGLSALAAAGTATFLGDQFGVLGDGLVDLNHVIDLPQSRSLTKEVLPDLTSGLQGVGEIADALPLSVEKTSKSIVKVNHEMDTFKTTGKDTAKTLTEINTNTQKSMISSVANNINTGGESRPINTKIELTLDGKKVAETVHNYKVPNDSVAGSSIRKFSIPSGEMI